MEELDGQLQAAREQLYEWRALKNHPGWKRLTKVIEAQKNMRVGNILRAPTQQIVDVFVREYERGEAAGLDLILEIGNTEIQRLEAEINLLESRLTIQENEDVDSNAISDVAP